jgi:hypothetical protein
MMLVGMDLQSSTIAEKVHLRKTTVGGAVQVTAERLALSP